MHYEIHTTWGDGTKHKYMAPCIRCALRFRTKREAQKEMKAFLQAKRRWGVPGQFRSAKIVRVK